MQDKVIAITGAFGALGRDVAAIAVQRGARVAAIDFVAQAPADVAAKLNGAELIGGANLSEPASAKEAIDKAAAKWGRLDALINIAGGFRWETVSDGGPETWDKLYALNVKTALNASRAALPHLLASGAGHIVNIGANGALKAGAGMGPYGASKSGVHRLTEAMAEELKGRVTVNAVLPSIIDTPANRIDMPNADFSAWVRPEELANVILFLASDQASAVTGALIPVVGRV